MALLQQMAAALLVILVLCTWISSSARSKQYCVKQDLNETSDCPCYCQDCYNITYYAENRDEYFTSNNTVFKFLEGNHSLTGRIEANNVFNLTFIKAQNLLSNPMVQCDNDGGLSLWNIHNLSISGLDFSHCSSHSVFYKTHNAIEIKNVYNMSIHDVTITNTKGYGLSINNPLGNTSIDSIVVENSTSFNYTGMNRTVGYGGNLVIYCNTTSESEAKHGRHFLTVSNSSFLYGNATEHLARGTGISMVIKCHTQLDITFDNVTVHNNTSYNGGNVHLEYLTTDGKWTVAIRIENSNIYHGLAQAGGGMYMTIASYASRSKNFSNSTHLILKVTNTNFSYNISPIIGAGVYARLHENYVPTIAMVLFHKCNFEHNKIITPLSNSKIHGGVSIHILTYLRPEYKSHMIPLFRVNFTECLISESEISLQNGKQNLIKYHNGALAVENVKSVSIKNCNFTENKCTAIIAINSNLLLHGKNTIHNNTGTRGGGILFCSGALMHLCSTTTLYIVNNTATEYGGGIFVEDEACSQAIPLCFFQVDNITANILELRKTQVYLKDNNAAMAGSALYGGLVDTCTLITSTIDQKYPMEISSHIFNYTFDYNGKISSDPRGVYFCLDNKTNSTQNYSVTTYPGATFHVRAILKGQRRGFVPGVVDAQCQSPKNECHLASGEKTQLVDSDTCSELNYTIFSDQNKNQILQLVAEDSYFEFLLTSSKLTHINIFVGCCPKGFSLEGNKCQCSFKSSQATCIILLPKSIIQPKGKSWIGFFSNSSECKPSNPIHHPFCPLDYCIENATIKSTDTTFDQDAQCKKRHGMLCGSCAKNYSIGFGSSDCLHCGKHNALRIVGLIVVCGVAGILLILLLTALNLTVSEGTLNGVIFYVNIVQVNADIFFQPNSKAYPLAVVIAWLNLDFGIKVCFADGMDEYTKTWLQFIFPFYIWLLSAGIIYFSWKYNIVARLAGNNTVKVLATLFLLSFGKLLRAIITVMSFTVIENIKNNCQQFRWLPDANIKFLHGKHITLFIFASLASVLVILYTLRLLFIQYLRRITGNTCIRSWVTYLKPLFDAYTAPYRDRFHFWTGLLLMVRIFLFICFATNVESRPSFNLSIIIMVCTVLLVTVQMRVYKHFSLGLLESFFYLNLILFSTSIMYISDSNSTHHIDVLAPLTVYTFGGSFFLVFIGIVIYHAYKQLFGAHTIGRLRVWWQERRWDRRITPIPPVTIETASSDDSDESERDNEMEALWDNNSLGDAPQLREPLIGGSTN